MGTRVFSAANPSPLSSLSSASSLFFYALFPPYPSFPRYWFYAAQSFYIFLSLLNSDLSSRSTQIYFTVFFPTSNRLRVQNQTARPDLTSSFCFGFGTKFTYRCRLDFFGAIVRIWGSRHLGAGLWHCQRF